MNPNELVLAWILERAPEIHKSFGGDIYKMPPRIQGEVFAMLAAVDRMKHLFRDEPNTYNMLERHRQALVAGRSMPS